MFNCIEKAKNMCLLLINISILFGIRKIAEHEEETIPETTQCPSAAPVSMNTSEPPDRSETPTRLIALS